MMEDITSVASGAQANFHGLRVLSLESRRAPEIQRLIENAGGQATVVPSLREVAFENNAATRSFAQMLEGDAFDITIWTTGVGARMLSEKLDTYVERGVWTAAVKRSLVVTRGPKPLPVLREWGVTADVIAPSPNTWREVLAAIDNHCRQGGPSLQGASIAIQDFPTMDGRLLEELKARGAKPLPIPVYRYELPEDVSALRAAVLRLVGGGFDCVLFTAGVQAWHLLRVTMWMNLESDCIERLRQICVGAVGPTCAEVLTECGFAPDIVPDHPKMGQLVQSCASRCGLVLQGKKTLAAAA